MSGSVAVAERIVSVLERVLGAPVSIRVRGWDGSEAGPTDAPTLVISSRRAVRRLLWQPNELGLARAHVAGELDVEGDLYDALTAITPLIDSGSRSKATLSPVDRGELIKTAVVLGAVGPQPQPPPEEASLHGRRHSRSRDRAAIRHHYDVGNDFYRIVLGPSLVYSCAYWNSPDATLETAQAAKLELICNKLGLRPGMRLLDVGCGWGSMAIHAAREFGVNVVGVTLSGEQVELARKRVVEAGLAGQVDIRLQDYRDVADGPFDAISSIGMAEHIGPDQFVRYAHTLCELLRPGGRLLNHQIARRPGPRRTAPTFISAYVFPDGELSPIGSTVQSLEEAGFEVRDVESLREHYALTLRQWVANLTGRWDEATRLAGAGRARVWRLYMAGSALAFEAGRIGVNQVLAVRTHPDGRSDLPPTRVEWLGA
ncbi:MAG TPA: cyclopropane-fatty-acyl-phospholipid synthase family protein [Actinomycetes bacterium]|nr:cyclopropane-fatty-acyl-phospholipid synthase family protein [Actinomycetes bacterium]